MLSSAMGELPPAECQAEVWVLNDEDAARAVEDPAPAATRRAGLAMRELRRNAPAPQFTQCWKCGAAQNDRRSVRTSAPG